MEDDSAITIGWERMRGGERLFWCDGYGEEYKEFLSWIKEQPLAFIFFGEDEKWVAWYFRKDNTDPEFWLRMRWSDKIDEIEFPHGEDYYAWDYDYDDFWWDDTIWDMCQREWEWEHGIVSRVRSFSIPVYEPRYFY